jgi:hypothetical protein
LCGAAFIALSIIDASSAGLAGFAALSFSLASAGASAAPSTTASSTRGRLERTMAKPPNG